MRTDFRAARAASRGGRSLPAGAVRIDQGTTPSYDNASIGPGGMAGTLTVTAPGTLLSNTGAALVSASGVGTLNILAGASVSGATGTVAQAAAGQVLLSAAGRTRLGCRQYRSFDVEIDFHYESFLGFSVLPIAICGILTLPIRLSKNGDVRFVSARSSETCSAPRRAMRLRHCSRQRMGAAPPARRARQSSCAHRTGRWIVSSDRRV